MTNGDPADTSPRRRDLIGFLARHADEDGRVQRESLRVFYAETRRAGSIGGGNTRALRDTMPNNGARRTGIKPMLQNMRGVRYTDRQQGSSEGRRSSDYLSKDLAWLERQGLAARDLDRDQVLVTDWSGILAALRSPET